MSAGFNNYVGEVGATFFDTIQYTFVDGTPINITGLEIEMQVRKCEGESIVLDASISNGKIVITDGVNGVFTITFGANEMALIEPVNYLYDIIITTSVSEVDRIMQGSFNVSQRITV